MAEPISKIVRVEGRGARGLVRAGLVKVREEARDDRNEGSPFVLLGMMEELEESKFKDVSTEDEVAEDAEECLGDAGVTEVDARFGDEAGAAANRDCCFVGTVPWIVAERAATAATEEVTAFGIGQGSADSICGISYRGRLSEKTVRLRTCTRRVPISSGGIHPGGKCNRVRPIGMNGLMSKAFGPGRLRMSKSCNVAGNDRMMMLNSWD